MKPIFTLSLILFVLSFSACKKNNLLLTTSDRLIGTWNYSEVRSVNVFSFDGEDITDKYEHLNLELKEDNSLTIFDMDQNEVYFGSWKLEYESVTTGEDVQWVEYLSVVLTNSSTLKTFFTDWKNLSVTKNKLRFTDHTGSSSIQYKLEK